MKKTNSGNYYTFAAENETVYQIMKNTKLSNNARRVFDDSKMSVEIKGKYNAMEYESMVNRSLPAEKKSNVTKKSFDRVAVVAGSVQRGDKLLGRTVTGLGKYFQPANDDFYSVNNIDPSADNVQYAYFN